MNGRCKLNSQPGVHAAVRICLSERNNKPIGPSPVCGTDESKVYEKERKLHKDTPLIYF
jgi:hypothetical protein